MKKLSPDVVEFFNRQRCVIVTTIDADGSAHNSCKGIVSVYPDGRVYLMDLYLRATFRNLKMNPRISITAVDEESFTGFCMKGEGSILHRSEIPSQVLDAWDRKLTERISQRLIWNLREEKRAHGHPEAHLPRPKYLIAALIRQTIELTPRHIKRKTGLPPALQA